MKIIVMRLNLIAAGLNGNCRTGTTAQWWGIGGTVVSESALRSAGTLLSRVRAPPPAPWPDGGPKSLRSPCCGLAICKHQNQCLSVLPTTTMYSEICKL
ncbi:hypothetical protein PoB_003918500 [Plakobranchus ocellatus]|uniref:Secreted protein n=1 Tax=Plakobranchus ocellatus TaxID=259542 RepID=A0AAV4AZH0_9GAST|nr:hypothetical protein PoB_003918500 [Plakobranchus ocellatus]